MCAEIDPKMEESVQTLSARWWGRARRAAKVFFKKEKKPPSECNFECRVETSCRK